MSKVLIIDDDAEICSLVGEFLRRNGHEVATAPDGGRGLAAAAAQPPDLILCDLEMPGMGGQEVVATLRRDRRMGEIPVIFLSACKDRGQIRRSMNLGGDDFITKPAPLPEVLETVNARLLRQWHQQQREEERWQQTVDVFAGIIHDLDQSAAGVRWLAAKAAARDGREKRIIDQVRESLAARQVSPAAGATAAAAPRQPEQSLLLKDASRRQFLKLSEVKALLACGEYSMVHWGDNGQHMMFRKALKMWQQELPPEQFFRVHRQAIINLGFIDYVEKAGAGRLQVHLRAFKPATAIFVSQRETPDFNRCLKQFQAGAPARS